MAISKKGLVAENWANKAAKLIMSKGWKLAKYATVNPWVWVVLTAWSVLPVDTQNYILVKIEQGIGVTFDSFEEFYDWLTTSDEEARVIASYINGTMASPTSVLDIALPELITSIPTKEKDGLSRMWTRNSKAGNSVMRISESAPIELTEHQIADNRRKAVTKRMQHRFNARGVIGTQELHRDLVEFVKMSDIELNGAISSLLVG
jgi:hypothetical protein